MSKSIFDYVGNLDTLLAVALGAILATTGALLAELVQDRLNRKRRERDAARFFGEVMSSMDRIIEAAINSQAIGEPWGPVTTRLFRTSLREAQVYERNRERLFDIRDMGLRTRIHTHMVRKSFPIDAIVEYAADLDAIDNAIIEGTAPVGTERRERLDARAERVRDALGAAFEAVSREIKDTDRLCTDLENIARVSFGEIAKNIPATPTQTAQQAPPED